MKRKTSFLSILTILFVSTLALSACGNGISQNAAEGMSAKTLESTIDKLNEQRWSDAETDSDKVKGDIEQIQLLIHERNRRFTIIANKIAELGPPCNPKVFGCMWVAGKLYQRGWWDKTNGMTTLRKGTPEAAEFLRAFKQANMGN